MRLAMARASSHICAASSSVDTSHLPERMKRTWAGRALKQRNACCFPLTAGVRSTLAISQGGGWNESNHLPLFKNLQITNCGY